MNLKIIGAGSAGMHHAHAARELGWKVDIVDVDPSALERLPKIYAQRYGAWDGSIRLGASNGDYDLVVIATPPETHIKLALQELGPVLIEKPLCAPYQYEAAKELLDRPETYVGYLYTLSDLPTDKVESLSVEWLEHWGHMLAAHPWLKDQHETYLGSTLRGGGPLCEHSHGLNLWQHIARQSGHGEVVEVDSYIDFDSAALTLRTEDNFTGLVMQDVCKTPAIKRANINGADYPLTERLFKKQLEHVAMVPKYSPLDVLYGLETMRVICDALA